MFKGHSSRIKSLIYTSDGKYLISGGADGKIIIWNVNAKEVKKEFPNHGEVIIN
ncbi:MAG: WD40 repeat domain-containing protein, partial [Promethearchaeota archaeon]